MKKLLVVLLFLFSFLTMASAGEIRRPTTYTGDTGYVTTVTNAYDGDDVSTAGIVSGDPNGYDKYITYMGWQAASGAYSRLYFNIAYKCIPNVANDPTANYAGCLFYVSLDGGAHWNNFYTFPNGGATTRTVLTLDIPPNTTLSNIQVKAIAQGTFATGTCQDPPDCTSWTPNSSDYGSAFIYGTWTDGTLGTTPSATVIRGTGGAASTSIPGYSTVTGAPNGGWGTSTSLNPNANDANTSTFATESASSTSGSSNQGKQWHGTGSTTGFSSAQTFGSMVLVMRASCSAVNNGNCNFYYTTNGGTGWSPAVAIAGLADYVFLLAPGTSLSNFQVMADGYAATGFVSPWPAASVTFNVYDVRVEGYPTNTPPTAYIDAPLSNGSTSVYQYQPVTFNGWVTDPESLGSTTITYSFDGGAYTGTGLTRTYRSDVTTGYNAGWSLTWNVSNTGTGTHNFKIQACDQASTCVVTGPYNFTVNAEPLPSTVTGLGGSATAAGTSITMNWTNPSNGQYYYYGVHLMQCTGVACVPNSTGSYVVSGSGGNGNVTTYTGTVTPCTTYGYQAADINHFSLGNWTSAVYITTPCAPTNPPASFNASGSSDGRTATLSWTYDAVAQGYWIDVCNAAGGAGCGAGWANANGDSVSSPFAHGSRSPGSSYSYRIMGHNAVGSTSYSYASLTMNNYPAAPAAPTATPAANGLSVGLSWTAVSGATSYKVYACAGSGCSSWAYQSLNPTSNSATWNSNICTVYRFYVTALNAVGESGAGTPTGNITTPCNPAGDATGVTASASADGRTATVNWTGYTVADVTTARIWRTINGGSMINDDVSGALRTKGYAVNPGDSVVFQIETVNAVGPSFRYISATPATLVMPNYGTAPSALSLPPGSVYSSKITLNWTDNSNNETTWNFARCSGSAGCTPVWNNNLSSTTTAQTGGGITWTDTGLTANTIYCYQVSAYNAVGDSSYTSKVCATTMAVPPSVSGVTVTPQSDGRSNLIAWTNPGGTATHIGIHYCVGASCGVTWVDTFFTDATLPAVNVTHTGLTPGAIYYYSIFSFNANDSPIYYTSGATYGPYTMANLPTQPGGFTAASQASGTVIDFGWTDVSNDNGYRIYYCVGAGCTPTTLLLSPALNAVTAQWTGASSNTAYVFKLVAVNDVGESTGATYSLTTSGPPATPNIIITVLGSKSVQVTWTDVAGETSYQMMRCTGAACGTFANQGTSQVAGTISFSDTGLTPGAVYTYRLSAINAAGTTYSNAAVAYVWGRLRRGTR